MTINWGSFLLQIITFIVLFLLLWKFAFGPLARLMTKRQERIAEQITSAEKNMLEAEKILLEQKENFQQARQEAQEIIERAHVSSSKQADDLIAAAKTESKRLKEQAALDIQHEKEKAVSELKNEIGSLSVLIASKMIGKELDSKQQAAFVDEMIKEVGEIQ
ncbi:MAG: F0F1 ATP synthase subunit B [Anaerovoracaceae bacterium]